MRRTILTNLAENGHFIPGLYNYCDRWCERCPLTSRCLVYATEEYEDVVVPERHDDNVEFWTKLASNLDETRSLIASRACEAGVDLRGADDGYVAEAEKLRADIMQDVLSVTATYYADEVEKWFIEFDQIACVNDLADPDSDQEESDRITEAREVIYWYQFQIAVKIVRALLSREEAGDEGPENDSDGSAKVALIALDRSISAWRLMQMCLPEWSSSIITLILGLERLRVDIERRFPNARDFIRPGFDEVLGEAN